MRVSPSHSPLLFVFSSLLFSISSLLFSVSLCVTSASLVVTCASLCVTSASQCDAFFALWSRIRLALSHSLPSISGISVKNHSSAATCSIAPAFSRVSMVAFTSSGSSSSTRAISSANVCSTPSKKRCPSFSTLKSNIFRYIKAYILPCSAFSNFLAMRFEKNVDFNCNQ